MGNLESHARRELEMAGYFGEGAEYGGMLAIAVLELVKIFAAQGHSGGSAHHTIRLFTQLASFKALTLITSNPNEWRALENESAGTWQNIRQSSLFSTDGGKTYFDVDDKDRTIIDAAPPAA